MRLTSINLLTHNDLDGVACAIIAKYFAKKLEVPCRVTMVGNQDLEKGFEEWTGKFETGFSGSLNIISDLPLGNLAQKFLMLKSCDIEHQNITPGNPVRSVMLIDHHLDSVNNPVLKFVNYECAVEIETNTGFKCKTCAAQLVWRFFQDYFYLEADELYEFVSIVRDWDTYAFTATLNPLAQKYNILYFQMGAEWFEDYIFDHIQTGTSLSVMDNTIKTLLDRIIEGNRIESMKRTPSEKWRPCQIAGTKVLVQICDNKAIYSELGATVSKLSDCVCMMVDTNGATSFRSSGDLDCNRLARIFGGGGHLNAAGCRITEEDFRKILNGDYANYNAT